MRLRLDIYDRQVPSRAVGTVVFADADPSGIGIGRNLSVREMAGEKGWELISAAESCCRRQGKAVMLSELLEGGAMVEAAVTADGVLCVRASVKRQDNMEFVPGCGIAAVRVR